MSIPIDLFYVKAKKNKSFFFFSNTSKIMISFPYPLKTSLAFLLTKLPSKQIFFEGGDLYINPKLQISLFKVASTLNFEAQKIKKNRANS